MKNVLIALFSLTTVGVLTVPTMANETEVSGDKVIIQDSSQGSYQEGYGNRSFQESSQTHREINRRRNGGSGSFGGVQTVDQYQQQFGERNRSRQTVEQRSEMRNGRKPRR